MALKIRGNTQIQEGSIFNEQLKNADVSLNKLSGSGSVTVTGSMNLSGASLTFANDQISGDVINGGSINNITINDLTVDSALDLSGLSTDSGLTIDADAISGDKIHGGNISGDLTLSGDLITISNELQVSGSALVVDSAGDVSMANDLLVSGNLTVSGTQTIVNSNEVNIGDAIILLNADETGAPSENAGIEVERGTESNKSFVWDETNDTWSSLSDSIYAGGGFSGNLTGNVTGNVDGDLTGSVKSDDGSVVLVDAANKAVNFINKTTTDLTEGNNLYYTQARFDSAFDAKDTDDLSEGSTNLYYLDSRARSAISVVDSAGDGSLSYDSSTGVITYRGVTESQVRGYISVVDSAGDGSLTYDSSTGVFNYKGISDAQLLSKFSVIDSAGDGSLSYDSSTGVFSYKGISDSQIYGKFTGGEGLTYDGSGDFSVNVDDSSIEIDSDALRVKASGITNDMLAGSISYNKIDFLDAADDLGASTSSDEVVPSQLAVKTYVDTALSSQSSADFAGNALEFKMGYTASGQMVNVKELIETHTIDSTEGGGEHLELDTHVELGDFVFEPISMVFVNGQKLRYSDDYSFSANNDGLKHDRIDFNSFDVEAGDIIEVRRLYIVS